MRDKSGFTIIELCIVLAIASTVLCFSVVSFRDIFLRQKINYITQSLNDSINFAREQAILRNITMLIYPVTDWQQGWVIAVDSSETTSIDPIIQRKVLKNYTHMPLKIIYISFQKNLQLIKIFPNGTSDGYQGHFEYGDKKLFINRGARTRLESDNL